MFVLTQFASLQLNRGVQGKRPLGRRRFST